MLIKVSPCGCKGIHGLLHGGVFRGLLGWLLGRLLGRLLGWLFGRLLGWLLGRLFRHRLRGSLILRWCACRENHT